MSAGVSALRGPAPALRSATPDERRPVRSLRPSGPQLPLALARGVTFLALATFGALHWMAMLEPTASERAWYAVGTGALAMGGLLGAARIASRALRWLAVAAVTVVALALAFLAAGTADELLRPDQWDTLAAGIARGIDALPGARVPYRGIDEWTRLVIPLGGTVLTVVAALAAFWPRRGRTGFPLVALILLVTLYAVPAVALDFEGEFLRGALLALLVLAFLRLERLRLTEARGAALLAAGTVDRGADRRPALDRDAPWWDYETWALSTAASHSTSFSWDHDYGPLDWPRDGREMLRVKARRPAYWKAESLDVFDGRRWREARTRRARVDRLRAARRPGRARPLDPAHRGQRAQPAHAHVRDGRHRHRRAEDAQPRRDPQRPDRHLVVEPHAAPRRHLHRAGLHPAADRARARGRGLRLRPRPLGTSARSSSTTTRRRRLAVDPDRGRLPGVGRGASAVLAKRPDPGTGGLEFIDGDEALADSRPAAHLGALAASSSAARTARSSTSRRSRPTSAAASPTRSRRRPRRARSRASCSRPSRATASSTRARWRCCCGWAASRRAWRPASRRARSTARPRSTSCATSTRTPGSRRGSPTSAGSRSTRRPSSAPPRSQGDDARHGARSATRPTSAAAARSTRAPARPRPRARTGG